jgi:antirestriction protein
MTELRIYVACLAAYNNGKLHGAWINAAQPAEDIWTEINAMLEASPENGYLGLKAEEWAIHDYEGLPRISEYESIERVAELAAGIEEHGDAFLAFLNYEGDGVTADDFNDRYRGEWESERAFAEEHVSELGWEGIQPGVYVPKGAEFEPRAQVNVLEALESYLDWDAITRALFSGDHYSADVGSTTYVFSAH